MAKYKKMIEQRGKHLLLTEPSLPPREDVIKRYELAKERRQAYHSVLEQLLQPEVMSVVELLVKAQWEMDDCIAEYRDDLCRELPEKQ